MRDGLLRRGEAAALRWDNLTIADDGSGRLTISRSKTDQTGEGAVLWISPQTGQEERSCLSSDPQR